MPDEKERTPVWVLCKPCGHKWIGVYLPMMASACAHVMGSLCCPRCASDARQIVLTDPPASS